MNNLKNILKEIANENPEIIQNEKLKKKIIKEKEKKEIEKKKKEEEEKLKLKTQLENEFKILTQFLYLNDNIEIDEEYFGFIPFNIQFYSKKSKKIIIAAQTAAEFEKKINSIFKKNKKKKIIYSFDKELAKKFMYYWNENAIRLNENGFKISCYESNYEFEREKTTIMYFNTKKDFKEIIDERVYMINYNFKEKNNIFKFEQKIINKIINLNYFKVIEII